MSAYFDSAIREMFRGWSSVATYKDEGAFHGRLHVHLTLDDDVFQASSRNKSELIDRLFSRSDARYAVDLVNKARKNKGLIHYGRKRR